MQEPEDPTVIDAADIVPSVPMPVPEAEAVRAGVTPHPSGLNRSQRRAAYREHKRTARRRRGL